MWLALDEVDEENGCVRYVRGSNHLNIRPHGRTGTLGFSQGITDYGTDNDLANEVALAAMPGDMHQQNHGSRHGYKYVTDLANLFFCRSNIWPPGQYIGSLSI